MTAQGLYYLIRTLVALVAIPFHEAGHALAAWLLGDDTAKREGRLSLNPRNFKNPKWGMALTALAGPVANLLLAYLAMVAWKLLYYWAPITEGTVLVARFLQSLVYMDVGLAVFNLIPVPPLDGSRILLAVLPQRIYFGVMKYERVILIIVLAAVWGGFLDGPLSVLNDLVWNLLDLGTFYIDRIAYAAYYASLGAVI